jgi:hypothetical protein
MDKYERRALAAYYRQKGASAALRLPCRSSRTVSPIASGSMWSSGRGQGRMPARSIACARAAFCAD